MDFGKISRRKLLQVGAALTLGSALGASSALAADTTIGFIYVGSRDDYGYNQAHAQGAAALKKMPGLKIVEEEKVAETDACEKTMESMINLDGATLLFPTSFGYYSPHMIKMANKFPKLRFEHCGGLWSEKDPKNAGSYFGYIDEAQYISGIAAGEAIPNFYRGGLKEEIVKVSPYGEMVSAEARKHADDIKAKLMAGDYVIFKGPIMDNKGKTVIAAGTDRGQKDPELEKMDYLVEGVIGATS